MKKRQKYTLAKLGKKVDILSTKIDTIATNLNDLTEITKEVANQMVTKTELNEFKHEAHERFDDLEAQVGPHSRKIDRLEDKVRIINTKIGLK